jgi:hypothetical protein
MVCQSNPDLLHSHSPRSCRKKLEFAHLQTGGVKPEDQEQLLAGADEEKKRTIMKIVRAVVR